MIKSNTGSLPTLLIDADADSLKTHLPATRHIACLSGNAREAVLKLRLDTLQNTIISTGHDRQNIALATLMVDQMGQGESQTISVRVDNRDLSVLFRQEVVTPLNQVDIIPFSLCQHISKQLFTRHSILGLQPDIVATDKDFHIVVVGRSALCSEIIYQLAVLAHLPNQNCLTIHCVDKDADAFIRQVKKQFTGIQEIPHLELQAHNLDSDTLAFFTDALWQQDNLTQIIIATEEDDRNLDIAINLQDTTFIQQTAAGTLRTKVLIALLHDPGLGLKIDQDKDVFANFYSFGNLAEVSTRENLIDEKLDEIAKLINYDYAMTKTAGKPVTHDEVQKDWMKASLNDRESSKSQAAHIDIKLLALNLQKLASDKPFATLLENNKAIFAKKLAEREISNEMLADYKAEYFPNDFSSLLNKLGRAEHNRWNAFHYLRGWQYDEHKDKKAKRHNCLLPLEQFHSDEARETYQYDLLSILNIPLYLAYTGYEIVEAA